MPSFTRAWSVGSMGDRGYEDEIENNEENQDEVGEDSSKELSDAAPEVELGEIELEEEDDGEDEAQYKTQHVSSISSGKELLLGYVNERMGRANPRLRASLTGLVRIDVTDVKPSNNIETYMYDGTKETPKLAQNASENFGCSIRLSETNLLRVARGELNPQVAMLSGKIQVKGELGLAVYFFNLVAPRTRAI